MRFVLDTNIAVAAMNGVASVTGRLAAIPGREIGIPIIAVAELYYGARRSRRVTENLERITALQQTFTPLPVTNAVVDRYGVVRADLESRGRPKGDFDVLIACMALEEDATLATADAGLLDGAISGLRAENWLDQAR